MKELRVYILETSNDFNVSGYDIENWKLYEQIHNKLTEEAEKYISLCEEEGFVYSIDGFENSFKFTRNRFR